ncbi:CDI toxin immunity protein [Paenibacillus sp. FSL R7-0331]|uniref:CDI toxin immunity protein n=1 Tax=Paenibacillus sp. FSL R7-0331 TaxID=1536773 RepID=UPI0004F7B7A4|nr:hypothetical protein [Paenibacillus sp. FSL R7-0331]AIQ53748.1 hypothetical protein R70331_20915 [Paenibacillus sp. FSL R7-0331]
MTLFEELIEVLAGNVVMETDGRTESLLQRLVEAYPITQWGRIDWNLVHEHYPVGSIKEAIEILNSKIEKAHEMQMNILWNNTDSPSVLVNLRQLEKHLDDILAVGSDTWVVCPDFSFVIEFFHDGKIVLGFKAI